MELILLRKAHGAIMALIVIVVVALSLPSMGQVPPVKSSLLFRIVLPRPSVCIGDDHVKVEAEIRNIGKNPIVLSPSGIRAVLSFTNMACTLEDGFRSNTITADPLKGRKSGEATVHLPGRSYRQTVAVPLDRDFFTEGIYRLTIGYSGKFGATDRKGLFRQSLTSNEVIFEVLSCSPSASGKDARN